MSLLGIVWNHKSLQISCRPDPARPALCLDSRCDVEIPQTVTITRNSGTKQTIMISKLLSTFFSIKSIDQFLFDKREFATVLSDYLHMMVQNLEQSIKMQVLLMDPIDHLVFVTPYYSTPSMIEEFHKISESIAGLNCTVVVFPAACAAHAMEQFIPLKPYLLCEWNEDLEISTAFSYDTLRHFSRTGRRYKLCGIGPKKWTGLIERHLRTEYHLAYSVNEQGARLVVNRQEIREQIDKLLQSTLNGEITSILEISGIDVENGKQRRISIDLSREKLADILTPVKIKVSNFLKSCIPVLNRSQENRLVFCGTAFTLFSDAVRKAIEESGIDPPATPKDAALMGLHYCVKAKPMLPYDCGVIIRPHGSSHGVGTLVLIRPAAIGQTRESEELKIKPDNRSTIEVSFYIRRFELEKDDLKYEIMKHHIFAPEVDDDGFTRITAAMKVEGDPDSEELTRVSITIKDIVANKEINFDRLKLSGREHMTHPPLRNFEELNGIEICNEIIKIQQSITMDEQLLLDINEWRNLFENKRVQKITRKNYATLLLHTVVGDPMKIILGVFNDSVKNVAGDTLLDDEFIWNASPHQFQKAGRVLLCSAMIELAENVAASVRGFGYTADWLARHPFKTDPDTDVSVARSFVNALSQDLTNNDYEDIYMQQADDILKNYTLTCLDPWNLNVVWEDHGD